MQYIINAKIVLEHGILWDGVLGIENGRIALCAPAQACSLPADAEKIDAQGLYVGPGFVDIHVHGRDAYFYEEPEKETAFFLSHGETTILAALYYNLPKAEFVPAIRRVQQFINQQSPCALAGLYMEGPYMNPTYGACPEQNHWRGAIKPEDYLPLIDAAGADAKVWVVAPERPGIEPFVRYAKERNPNATISVGHSEATPDEIRRLKKYGLGMQTHCMNATGAITRWEGTKGCGPDEACLLDDEMYAEVICDSCGIHVNRERLRLLLKIKGAERLILITDSFPSTEQGPEELRHITDLVFDSRGLLNGSRLTMDAACRNMMMHTGCGMTEAFWMASRNPARVIGMADEIGTIEPGKKANLVFCDDAFHVKNVMLEGQFQEISEQRDELC